MGEENQGKDNQHNPQADNSSKDLKSNIKDKVHQFVEDPNVGKVTGFIKKNVRGVISGVLTFLGVVTFPFWWSGISVALGLMLCFYNEIKSCVSGSFFSSLKEKFSKNSVLNNVILFGGIFFLFARMTAFMVTACSLLIVFYFLGSNDNQK
ncbi:MAG: hypothetical protein RSB82_00290 [Victivallaceae bacterium]